jgi:hypothetical protein
MGGTRPPEVANGSIATAMLRSGDQKVQRVVADMLKMLIDEVGRGEDIHETATFCRTRLALMFTFTDRNQKTVANAGVLRLCPLCGSDKVAMHAISPWSCKQAELFAVGCEDCGCQGPVLSRDNYLTAIDGWNDRMPRKGPGVSVQPSQPRPPEPE